MATCEREVRLENLWDAYRVQRDPVAREELIVAYLGLVKYIAGRLAISLPPGVDSDDLFSYGVLGLMDALEKFDPCKGVKFESYASIRVRGAILEGMRAEDWVPRSVRRQAREISRVVSALSTKLGRMPTDQEIAHEMEMEPGKLSLFFSKLNAATLISLNQPFYYDEEGREFQVGDTISEDPDQEPESILDNDLLIEMLSTAIDALPERDRLVITLYYYEELTLKEIAKILGVTESRISQIHTRAILKLRGFMEQA